MTRPKAYDRVLLTLCCVGAFALGFGGFVTHADNRLVNGEALALWRAPWPNAALIIAALATAVRPFLRRAGKPRAWAALFAGAALFFACLAGGGHFADMLAAGARPAARTSLGSAFWILVAVALLAMLDGAQRAGLSLARGAMFAAALAAGFALMAHEGAFANLALAREYSAHRVEFAQQLWRHLELVGAAVTLALIFSLPLTALALRRAGARGPLFAALESSRRFPRSPFSAP